VGRKKKIKSDIKDPSLNSIFGLHVMLDMYNCDKNVLDNGRLICDMLHEITKMLGMKKLLEPIVVYASPNEIKDPGGYSGFVMIQESHISIHTFVGRKFATIDAYSCRDFDANIVIEYFKKAFKTDDFESCVEARGKKYPGKDI